MIAEPEARPVVQDRHHNFTFEHEKNEQSHTSAQHDRETEQASSNNSVAITKEPDRNGDLVERAVPYQGPPPLPYNLRDHKRSIFLNWLLIILDSACLPIILYYTLVYETKLRPGIVFAIITSVCGILSPIKYFFGILRLIKKDSKYMPIGSKRWRLDYFHVTFTVGYTVYLIELIIGSAPHHPWVRLLALPAPSTIFCMGIMIGIPQVLYMLGRPNIYRVSSFDKGHPARPGVYSYIEDVVAVEGFGGPEWRIALHERYEKSPYFEHMLSKLSMFWIFGSFAMTAVCFAVVFTTIEPVAYTFGWAAPFIWGGVWAWITIVWTRRMLHTEKREWVQPTAGVPHEERHRSGSRPTRPCGSRPSMSRPSMSRPSMSMPEESRPKRKPEAAGADESRLSQEEPTDPTPVRPAEGEKVKSERVEG